MIRDAMHAMQTDAEYAHLVLEDVDVKVTERQFVTSGYPIEDHLEGDGGIEMVY